MIRTLIKVMCADGVIPNMTNVGYITPEEYAYIRSKFESN